VETLLPEVLSETVSCLAEDLEISGIKIGMLATPGNVDVVSDFLDGSGLPRGRIVLDPVLKSSSGKELLSEDGVARLRQNLLPRVGWLTPNSEELTALTGMAARDKRTVEEAAARLMGDYAGLNLVVTGGHLDSPDDYVRLADGKAEWLAGRRIMTTSTHGTGCAFSSALLALLVLGEDPLEAAAGAKAYVSEAMAAAPGLGKGWGPLDLNAARLVHDDGENQ
jgi:hydroxymethylpyrimidine/phosphomethylpyrimidine kinase